MGHYSTSFETATTDQVCSCIYIQHARAAKLLTAIHAHNNFALFLGSDWTGSHMQADIDDFMPHLIMNESGRTVFSEFYTKVTTNVEGDILNIYSFLAVLPLIWR